MRQLHDQMHNETNRRLIAIEQTVKTQVGQMVRSNQLIDAYAKGLTQSLLPAFNETFRGSISETVPQWDRCCANIFTQLNETFQKGLAECKFFSVYLCFGVGAGGEGAGELQFRSNAKISEDFLVAFYL